MTDTKKTPDEWLKQPAYQGIVVYDPDGWDRKNFDESWAEEITEAEFNSRLATSTCMYPPGYWQDVLDGKR